MLNTVKKSLFTHAFFDVDETRISTKSMLSFMEVYFSMFMNEGIKRQFDQEMLLLIKNNASRSMMNRRYYSYFSNFPIINVQKACKAWFDSHSYNKENFYHRNITRRLKTHQRNGVECVFVSGSFRELLQPIADDLGINHILCINLERNGLMHTGNILPPQTIDSGKADAVRAFLKRQNALLNHCYAYGDDISDVPMLEIVGNPIAVRGGRCLEEYAIHQGWKIIDPS